MSRRTFIFFVCMEWFWQVCKMGMQKRLPDLPSKPNILVPKNGNPHFYAGKGLPKEGIEPSLCCQNGILNPIPNYSKDLQKHIVTDNAEFDFAKSLAILLQKYPDLGELIQAWPGLSLLMRAQIMGLLAIDGKP